MIGEAIRKRDAVRGWIAHGGNIDDAIAGLCGAFGVAAEDTIEAVDTETTEGPLLPPSHWIELADALARGTPSDQQQAERLRVAARASGEERAATYRRIFLTGAGELRQRVVTAAIETAEPALAQRLYAERKRVAALFERRKAVVCRDRTRALITVADAVITR